MVLHRADEHFVARSDVLAAIGLRNQIYALSGTAHKDDFVPIGGMDELLCRCTSRFVLFSRALRKVMHAPMHVGIVALVVADDRIGHGSRLLGCGSIIQINELVSVYLLIQDWEVSPDLFYVVAGFHFANSASGFVRQSCCSRHPTSSQLRFCTDALAVVTWSAIFNRCS